ncbi:MAG: sulfatase-like hydrolase/transferase [Coraliomargaritaceae bacterium]
MLLSIASVHAENTKPNILWIVTDDHRYHSIRAFNQMLHWREMSALGYVESPLTDLLAAMGTTFIHAYCQAQGCAPSRASMHYGRYPFRSGVYEFEYHNNNAEHCRPTVPERMVEQGYQTVHVGKLGVRLRTVKNGRAIKPSLYQTDIYFRTLAEEGLAEWGKMGPIKEIDGQQLKNPIQSVEFLTSDDGQTFYISEQLENENPQFSGMAKEASEKLNLLRKPKKDLPATVFTPGILGGVSPRKAGNTRDGFYTKALKDVLKNKDKDFQFGKTTYSGVDSSKPLFLHIGYDFPHTPVLPPREYWERFRRQEYKLPKFTQQEWETMPKQLKRQVKVSYSDDLTDEQKLQMIQDYYAFCAYGDDLVGQSADAFIEYCEDLDQPWMIVYVCGDHGWKLNEHGAYSKFTPWEVDSHNPIIVVSSDKKKFPAGRVVTDYVEFVDLAPTFLAAAGEDLESEKNQYLDGYDLAEITSGRIPARDYVIGESHAVTGPRAYIRTKEYVFSMQTRPHKRRGEDMDWALHADWEDLDPALYHSVNDPNEINNLAYNKEYERIARAMK